MIERAYRAYSISPGNLELEYMNIALVHLGNIYGNLRNAEKLYPNFPEWFWGKVVSGLADGTREILIESRNDSIAGLAIVKKDTEKKLCTLRIGDAYQNRGLGIKLFCRSFETLETEKPFLTVSEEKYPEFQRIFDYFGFRITSVRENLYRNGKKEFFLNED